MLTQEEQQLLMAVAQQAMQSGDTAMQSRLAEIQQMGPAEQKAAIADLSQDYEGRNKAIDSDMQQAQAMSLRETPKGGMAGNNQFSVYVGAGPLEHAVAGGEKYMGQKGMKEGRGKREDLSLAKERASSGLMSADMRDAIEKLEEEERRKRGFGYGLERA